MQNLQKKHLILSNKSTLSSLKRNATLFSYDAQDNGFFSAAKDANINISKAISANKFEPTDLITGQKDIKAFRELFGEIKDARRTIVNNMQAMASITARDKFYL